MSEFLKNIFYVLIIFGCFQSVGIAQTTCDCLCSVFAQEVKHSGEGEIQLINDQNVRYGVCSIISSGNVTLGEFSIKQNERVASFPKLFQDYLKKLTVSGEQPKHHRYAKSKYEYKIIETNNDMLTIYSDNTDWIKIQWTDDHKLYSLILQNTPTYSITEVLHLLKCIQC